jgi:hypothetical protein
MPRISNLLAGCASVPAGAGAGRRCEVHGNVQGVPAEPEASQLQHRSGHAKAAGGRRIEVIRTMSL